MPSMSATSPTASATTGPSPRKWGKIGGFSRADVARMQTQFEAEGHDVGGTDGLIGFKTRVAVGRWQAEHGDRVTCMPDAAMVKSIH